MLQKTKLSLAVAAISAGMSIPNGVFAVESDTESELMQEVIVTGIRGALTASMDVKRNESGVVDAISAEDIGKFPDANLAESLQRITGVSIDRQNNEGNQITVRGLGPSFNMVTLNGRQMPVTSSPEQESIASATQSRAFNFAEIASESVTGVQVYKTARSNVPSGGMGATVNIQTARPFDYGETTAVFSLAGIHDASVEEGDSVTPELGGLFSTILAEGRVGLLANFSYSERNFSELSTHTDGWLRDEPKASPTDPDGSYEAWCNDPSSDCGDAPYVYRPVSTISEIQHNERTRTNAQFVAQFAPTEELEITLDYVLSRFERDQSRYLTGLFGVVAGSPVINTRLTENFTVDSANRTSFAADALVYENELVIENDSFGLNLDWQVTDSLSLTFDAHSSEAVSQPDGELNDNLQILQGPLGVGFDLDYSPSGVSVIVDASGANRDGRDVSEFQDVDGFSPLGSVLRNIAIENTIDQYQFRADWDFDEVVVTAGLSYTEYEVETKAISTGFQFQGLGDCNGCVEAFTRSIIDAPSGFDTVIEFDVNALVEATFPTQIDTLVENFPPTFFGAVEESLAAFFNLETELKIGGLPGRLSVGVRYEDTDVSGSAFQTFPIALGITSNTEGIVVFDPNAEEEFFTVDGSYEIFLPSLDFQIEPTEETVARFSYGKSIARPDLNALRPITTISDYRPSNSTASSGNPNLKPYIADNIDLAFEWYYAEGSYASVTFFYKQVEDYIATDVENDVILDSNGAPLLDPQGRFIPTTGSEMAIPVFSQPGDPEAIFSITRPLNSEERTIDGWEFAIQHLFGDSGFGVQANYTVVSSDAEYDPNNFEQQSILIGLSDSYNLVGFYENDLFSVRLAANWRDEFLFSENQLRAPNEPVFYDEYLQFDLSASYALNDNLTIFFEALNITGEDQEQRGRFNDQFLLENDQEPRYSFGLRGTF